MELVVSYFLTIKFNEKCNNFTKCIIKFGDRGNSFNYFKNQHAGLIKLPRQMHVSH